MHGVMHRIQKRSGLLTSERKFVGICAYYFQLFQSQKAGTSGLISRGLDGQQTRFEFASEGINISKGIGA
jgi:hypothetical protein